MFFFCCISREILKSVRIRRSEGKMLLFLFFMSFPNDVNSFFLVIRDNNKQRYWEHFDHRRKKKRISTWKTINMTQIIVRWKTTFLLLFFCHWILFSWNHQIPLIFRRNISSPIILGTCRFSSYVLFIYDRFFVQTLQNYALHNNFCNIFFLGLNMYWCCMFMSIPKVWMTHKHKNNINIAYKNS